MAYSYPVNTDFKSYFVRDFPYGTDPTISILDADIDKAIYKTTVNINQGLFETQESFTLACLLLDAHYLVLDMRSSSQGISAKFEFPVNSKAVGSVSTSYSIPQRLLDNPILSAYYSTAYGAEYINMVLPLLSGQIFLIDGGTQPL